MKQFKIFQVGGSCRDMLLGLQPKDLDYTCECSFDQLRSYLQNLGLTILHEKPEFLTMRVKRQDGKVVDFSCCRSEVDYDGRRPGSVKETNLLTDLGRRDFTINAMAMEVDSEFQLTGNLIDPHSGKKDLENKILKFVGDPKKRLEEDGLRWLRAIRFHITRDLSLDDGKKLGIVKCDGFNWQAVEGSTRAEVIDIKYDPLTNVSVERIREELYKCFKHDTLKTLEILNLIPSYWMKDNLWLIPTLENK